MQSKSRTEITVISPLIYFIAGLKKCGKIVGTRALFVSQCSQAARAKFSQPEWTKSFSTTSEPTVSSSLF